MFCPKCGKQIPDGATFCPECGAPITNSSSNVNTQQYSIPNTFNKRSDRGLDIKNKDTILAIVGALFWIISSFLPCVSVSAFGYEASKSLIEGGDGWIFVIFAIVAIILLYFQKDKIFYVIVGLGTALNIYEVVDISNILDEADIYAGFIHKKAGYYMLVLGTLMLIASAILLYLRRKNTRK